MTSVAILAFAACDKDDASISFNRDIRPILNAKCLKCHGGVKANGGFSLLFEEDAFAPTESGKPAIVRGNHRKSALFQRLVHEDPELRMPLEAPPLHTDEIEKIGKWIDEGAHWQKHWAYIPPDINAHLPSFTKWQTATMIDKFVATRLEAADLTPEPSASHATLLRRLYLDLTGLPPSPDEADMFFRDTSASAYGNLVDRLLASPHFGERWATMWLDLARFADTKGYEKDSNREIWKFRDYVIQSFNSDKPFDQFSVEQLAGDLLPDPSSAQLIATAFHRNAVSNDEGGTDDEEFRMASVIERVGNTYETWQGTTMSCVQCHSHPYDPFRQEDFYTSMAYFNNTQDRDVYNEQPKFFYYPSADSIRVASLIEEIEEQTETFFTGSSGSLHDHKMDLFRNLDFLRTEAEEYYASSYFIELIWPELDVLWQVQDSSWIYFRDIDLRDIESISFRVATKLKNAGSISIHLDSVNAPALGFTKIHRTADWERWMNRRPPESKLYKEFEIKIPPQDGKHDLYVRFWVGDKYEQHLFFLDRITYHKNHPRYKNFGPNLEDDLEKLYSIAPHEIPITRERAANEPRTTYLLDRGSWLSPQAPVDRALPTIFSNGDSIVSDRLKFAQWLVSEQNPLTARVMVNRIWEQIFGQGLVSTMEEFGSQGEPPTHPLLLDYLAIQLMQTYEWRLKPLIKEIVMSDTYRQSSEITPDKLALDPQNKLLSRGARVRLSAETLRDQILATGGILNSAIGGPSVIIPQMEISESKIPSWAITDTSHHHRRSLYLFWQRTNPLPNMITFDSPDRTICTSSRVRTNTPLQALNLLNDDTYIQASAGLAKKMLDHSNDLSEQLKYGYWLLTYEDISEEKLHLLQTLFEDAILAYSSGEPLPDLPDAKAPKEKKTWAAMMLVGNALFNLDEIIVKK